MEVGIEDCLHIEFEYDKAAYHLRDVVVGHIYFLLVCSADGHNCSPVSSCACLLYAATSYLSATSYVSKVTGGARLHA